MIFKAKFASLDDERDLEWKSGGELKDAKDALKDYYQKRLEELDLNGRRREGRKRKKTQLKKVLDAEEGMSRRNERLKAIKPIILVETIGILVNDH